MRRSIVLGWVIVMIAGACAETQGDQSAWNEDIDAYAEGLKAGHLNLFHTLFLLRRDRR
ncbi:MAG: hypothetical protein AAF608_00750 [Pseudomonadota bacterium]